MVHLISEATAASVSQAAAGNDAALDLQQFCGTDECRPYLMKPFSREGFTWATNGHILVRVEQRSTIPDIEQKINIAKPLQGIETAEFFRPLFELPPAPTEAGLCFRCEGRGHVHDCPDCECGCSVCGGEGELDRERRISTSIGPKSFCLYYVRQILSLPEIELAALSKELDENPTLFRFDGGVGAVMPILGEFEHHIDIKLGVAAASGT